MPETSPRTLGELLAKRLEDQKTTPAAFRTELSAKYGIDVTPQTIWNWLHGERCPRLGTLLTLLDALDVYGTERDVALRLASEVNGARSEPSEAA